MTMHDFEKIRVTIYEHLPNAVDSGAWGLASKLVRDVAVKMPEMTIEQQKEVREWLAHIEGKCLHMYKGVSK